MSTALLAALLWCSLTPVCRCTTTHWPRLWTLPRSGPSGVSASLPCCCVPAADLLRACRNLRQLLEELIAIAAATKGKADFHIDLLPTGEDFEP